MNKFRRLLYKFCRVPLVPVTTATPPANSMQIINPENMILRARPLLDYGLRQLSATNPRRAMTEVTVISYLMGMGLEFRTAKAIAGSWEENETFLGECERGRLELLLPSDEEAEQNNN